MVDYSTISIVFAGLSVGIAAIYYTLTLRSNQRAQQLQRETMQAQLFMQSYQETATAELQTLAFTIMQWARARAQLVKKGVKKYNKVYHTEISLNFTVLKAGLGEHARAHTRVILQIMKPTKTIVR